MPKWLRLVLIVLIGTAGIAGVGLYYEHVVRPAEPVWDEGRWAWPRDRFPMTVGGIPDDAAASAVAEWNRLAGCQLLRYVAQRDPKPDIELVDTGVEPGEGADGTVDAERAFVDLVPGQPARGRIELRNVLAPHHRHLAIGHGIGHVLGLAHDPSTRSWMHRRVLENAEEFPLPGPTTKDGEAVRGEYCGRP